jgi:hypothetical protein
VADAPLIPAYQPDRAKEARNFGFDPTGFYQQAAGDYPVTVQLNAAGLVVAGWFAMPPGEFAQQASLGSWPAGSKPGSGAFLIDMRQARRDGGYHLHWWSSPPDAAGVVWTDPTWFGHAASWEEDAPVEQSGVGTARFPQPGAVELRFHPAGSQADSFTRYAEHPRIPTSVIATAEGHARDLLTAHHARPIGPRWLERIVRNLSSPRVAESLREWKGVPIGATPAVDKLRRQQVMSAISCAELRPGALPPAHADLLRSYLNLLLASVALEIDGQRRSLLEWFTLVAAAEPEASNRVSTTNLGIAGLHRQGWAYIVDMVPVSPDLSRVTVVGKVAPTVFLMGIRRLRVTFEMAGVGPKLDASGNPVVTDPAGLKAAEDEKVAYSGRDRLPKLSERVDREGANLAGFLGEIGAGLELDLRKLLKSLSALAGAELGGADPAGRVTYFSSAELTTKDFDGAWYSRAYLGGPGGGVPAAQVGTSSALHTLTLRNGLSLSRVETKVFDAEVKMPSSRELASGLVGSFTWFKDLLQPKVQLASLGMSLGYVLMFGTEQPSAPSQARTPPPPALVGGGSGRALFERDSPRLLVSTSDLAADGRALLEASFATARALLCAPQASVTATGTASPEGPEAHNVWLSAARSSTVVLALEAACPWQHAGTMAIGLGEAPARTSGLDDPPLEPAALATFLRANPGQVAKWPRWRRVDVAVSGRVVVKGYEASP